MQRSRWNVVTYDETWIFQCDSEIRHESVPWDTSASPRIKKLGRAIPYSKRWKSEKENTRILEKRRLDPAPEQHTSWQSSFWRKAPFLCWHTHFIPQDLAPYDFYLFPKIESALKEARFVSRGGNTKIQGTSLTSCCKTLLPRVETPYGALWGLLKWLLWKE